MISSKELLKRLIFPTSTPESRSLFSLEMVSILVISSDSAMASLKSSVNLARSCSFRALRFNNVCSPRLRARPYSKYWFEKRDRVSPINHKSWLFSHRLHAYNIFENESCGYLEGGNFVGTSTSQSCAFCGRFSWGPEDRWREILHVDGSLLSPSCWCRELRRGDSSIRGDDGARPSSDKINRHTRNIIHELHTSWHLKIWWICYLFFYYRFLSNNGLLHLHDLCDVVTASLKFCGLDAVIDADKDFSVDIPTVINASQVFDKIVHFHSTVGFKVWRVEVSV